MSNSKSNKTKKIVDTAKSWTVQALDQNDDGKVDSTDASILQQEINETATKAGKKMKQVAADAKTQIDLTILQPVSINEINSDEFSLPSFICVTEKDRKHSKKDICQDSVGHWTGYQNRFLTIYKNKVSSLGLSLYPDDNYKFYFVDPTDNTRYIGLEIYFSYLRTTRISELQKIAQDLGAKHFKVTYKEKKKCFTKINASASVGEGVETEDLSASVAGKIEREHHDKAFESIEVVSENTFPGSEPMKPRIKYLSGDPVVQGLIDMRLKSKSRLKNQKIYIDLRNTCGMKEHDAIEIDRTLNNLKQYGNITFESELQNESRRILQYEIEF